MTQSDLEIHNLRTEFNVTMKSKNEFVQLATTQRGEIKSLKAELSSMTEQRDRAQKEAKNLAKRLTTGAVVESAEVAELFRDHLSESKPGDGNEWEERARQVMWNEEDAKAARQEGIDE